MKRGCKVTEPHGTTDASRILAGSRGDLVWLAQFMRTRTGAILNKDAGTRRSILASSPAHPGHLPVTESFFALPSVGGNRHAVTSAQDKTTKSATASYKLIQLHRRMLRYARSLPPGPKRNERRQIASSLHSLFRNKRWLDAHVWGPPHARHTQPRSTPMKLTALSRTRWWARTCEHLLAHAATWFSGTLLRVQ